ncbi:hypothetical protein [Mammaliicoccus vitulinus]|uniref:hypothetical protein n=1 Tax=Mammaliicoccus vitulinus TaxID=71237 RepID=UPI00248CE0D1|nr:hypothetical protein [Mammaliicoccus vitulinus]
MNIKPLRTEPIFVKPSDFNNYTGKDINLLLHSNSNESNKANLFFVAIEDKLLSRIDMMSFRLSKWENLSPYQLECLQKAIIYQAEYVLRNSDLSTDSGYDVGEGEKIDYDKLQKIAICGASIDILTVCGLINHVIQNRRRTIRLF